MPTPKDELERRILAGDITGVMDCIDAADAATRAAMRPTVERLIFGRWPLLRADPENPLCVDGRIDKDRANRLFRATELARFMCSADLPPCDYWMHVGIQDIAAYKARYAPPPSPEPIEKHLRGDSRWSYFHHIQRAIVAGLVERPQTDEYIDALFFHDLRTESNLVLKHVDADPGLAPCLLQLFEHEGAADRSFAAVEKYCHDPELTWSHAFLVLCERGIYTRTQLLDKTLGALACDWPQFKSGWFSRFHDLLQPTLGDMAPQAHRYLALCHSRIAPTAGLALKVVAALYKARHISAEAACEAAAPLAASAVKAQALAALDLLGLAARDAPALARRASAMAAPALGHTGADVQKKAITFLTAHGLDEDGRATASSYLPHVAAVNRPALAALAGDADALPADPAPAPVTPRALSPLDASRALAPLTHIPDVVERLAYVLENPADVDEWERVAAALVRLAPIADADRGAFLALQKRTRRLDWTGKPLPFALARILAAALDGEGTAEDAMADPRLEYTRDEGTFDTPDLFIAPRTQGLIAQALKGQGLTPLSTPTHRGGFIDPRELVARIQAHADARSTPALSEQVLALMRLAPAPWEPAGAAAALAAVQVAACPAPLFLALRHALGDDTVAISADDTQARPLFLAAARIRSPHADDPATLAAYGDLGPGGPVHARIDWQATTRTTDYGYTFHYLDLVYSPAPQPPAFQSPGHTALALCAKHLAHTHWAAETQAAHIRFTASLLPSGLEPFFAEAARSLGNNLNWDEAQWQNRAYLDVLLESAAPLGPMAHLLLAVALAGKEPGQTTLAVDALANTVQDGRLDVPTLGAALARLWATPLVKGTRYAKSLTAAANAHTVMPPAVFALVCALLEAPASTTRKDVAPLLELLLELKLSHQLALPPTTRSSLAGLKPSGKGKAALKMLLEKDPP